MTDFITPVLRDADASARPPRRPSTIASFRAMYTLLLRNQLSRGRIAALGGLGVVGILVGFLVTHGADVNTTVKGTRFVNVFGLSLLTPVAALVFGVGALGDLVEDRSLVYLWLPPVPRWVIAVAAWSATFTACLPFAVLMLVAIAAATGGGGDLLLGTFWAGLLALLAYSGLFTLLGLRFKRALVWGLVYLLIWENFIARAGAGTARLSILSYARSVLSAYTGVGMSLADRALTWSFAVPVAVGVIGVIATARRLHTQDID